jgi:hypothetical protein
MIDPTIATDAVTKVSQYGLTGVCVLLVAAVVYMAKMLLAVISKTNQIIANSITQSMSVQQSLKDIVANNTKATENNTIATTKSCEILTQLKCEIEVCPKR